MATTVKGAVIGYGFIASTGHVPAYLQRRRAWGDVQIVAVADVCEARRQAAAAVLPEARVYADFRDLLEREAFGLDFVDICTPAAMHAEIARQAFARGLHVMCEKPLAVRPQDAIDMLGQAVSAGRVLFPCHNYRFAPVVREINRIIGEGRIGKTRSVTLSTFRPTHARGVREWQPDWRRDPAQGGGGIAMDHGSHSFYLTFDWMGSYPRAVTAHCLRLPGERTESEVAATLLFPNGLAQVYLSWNAGVRKVIYTVQGSSGAIIVDDDELQLASAFRPSEPERRRIASDWGDASHVHWFEPLFERFRAAISEQDYAGRDAREAVLCVDLIDAVYRSAGQGGREIRLSHPHAA